MGTREPHMSNINGTSMHRVVMLLADGVPRSTAEVAAEMKWSKGKARNAITTIRRRQWLLKEPTRFTLSIDGITRSHAAPANSMTPQAQRARRNALRMARRKNVKAIAAQQASELACRAESKSASDAMVANSIRRNANSVFALGAR